MRIGRPSAPVASEVQKVEEAGATAHHRLIRQDNGVAALTGNLLQLVHGPPQ